MSEKTNEDQLTLFITIGVFIALLFGAQWLLRAMVAKIIATTGRVEHPSDSRSLLWPSNNEHLGKELLERNHDLMEKFLADIKLDLFSYYIENMTVRFLRETLTLYKPSQGEYFNTWISRSDLPRDVLAFGNEVYRKFKDRYNSLQDAERHEKANKATEVARQILASNEEKVKKFLEIAYRKVSTIDDYGDENIDAFEWEVLRLIKKLACNNSLLERELRWFDSKRNSGDLYELTLCPISTEIRAELKKYFSKYYKEEKIKESLQEQKDIHRMNGAEFERFLINLLRAQGVTSLSGTPQTGDQGA
ncbi:MAG: hypothetical protein AABZ55_08085, partial [Bdellovibrionota bacterium]